MMPATTIPLTAIILTYNEEANIKRCLRALTCVADVVIVDSGSADETLSLAVAERVDVRIFKHPFQDFGDQRNWAIDNVEPRFQWLLFVDADEYCDVDLLHEIKDLLGNTGNVVGGYIAGRNHFQGRWLKYSTMFPSYQLRLLRRDAVRYQKEGHGQREVTAGPLHYLKCGWRHEGFSKGVHQWVARHNQYSTDEVELILRLRGESIRWSELVSMDPIVRRRAMKVLASRLPARALLRFLYTFILRRGFLDGRAGLDYCLLRLAHDLHIGVKLRERMVKQGNDEN